MPLPAARQQRAAGFGISAFAGRGRSSPSSRLSRAAGGERVGDQARALADLAPGRAARRSRPSCISRRLSISRAPLPSAMRGQPIGPALADEGLDDRGLGVVVEDDLSGEMVGAAGRDVDDLDEARRRMVAAELQRPAACRRGGRADDWSRAGQRRRPSGADRRRSAPSTNSSRGPVIGSHKPSSRRQRASGAPRSPVAPAQASRGKAPACAPARTGSVGRLQRQALARWPGREGLSRRSRRHLPIAFALELMRQLRRRPSGRSGRRPAHGRNRAPRCRAGADNG